MAMTDKQKGIMDELTDALSEAGGGVMTGSFINEIKGLMDALSEGGSVNRGLDTPAESDYLNQFDIQPYTSVQPQGYDQMINQGYDSWSPSDGISGEGNPHIGEPISNLGLPDTASYQAGYSTGTGLNPNWGSGRYNYKKNIYDVQTINMMINQGAINPKQDQIIPRPDVGDGQYEVKLAQTENTQWNDQLQMFMSPDWLRSGSMGQEQFKQNYMGGQGNYDSLRSNTYPGSSNQLLDFNRYS
jgi:hypothetical protein